MNPEILICIPFPAEGLDMLNVEFSALYAPGKADLDRILCDTTRKIRGVVTNGAVGIDAATIGRLPDLEIILTQGAGFEGVDLAVAARRGIVVANGSGANATSVAEHGFALMLSLLRDIPEFDRAVHAGHWLDVRKPRPLAQGKRLGILGLGEIGSIVARYATAFDMKVSYLNRTPRRDVSFRCASGVIDLASTSDVLLVACPGGAETRHLINDAALSALGPSGFLVNVSRGSVVDTDALTAALTAGGIAGAALDVVDGEPQVPAALLQAPNLIITPHIAGNSQEAIRGKILRVSENLRRHFAGKSIKSRII